MSNTDTLLEHLRSAPEFEVDHGIAVYLEPGKCLSWRDTKTIRESGYKIQDIENREHQTKVMLVKDE